MSHIRSKLVICFLGCFFFGLLMPLSTQAATKSPARTFKVEKRFLYIQPGQTVFSIVKVLYPDQKKRWPAIIQEILKKNPHAFERGDITRIKVGERIELPALASNLITAQAIVYKGVEAVGQVTQARGKAFAISLKKKRRDLEVGSEVFVGDRLFTGVDGFLRLSMIDEAKIDLRCNSEMRIEDYQLLRAGNRSVIYLIKGSLRKITGSIGKVAKDVYEMRTPMATVGVRGTDYALRVMQSYGCDGSLDVNHNGLFVKVNSGAIDLKNAAGSVALNAGDAALVDGKNASAKAIDADDGIFDAVAESWYWWLLGILAIAAAA